MKNLATPFFKETLLLVGLLLLSSCGVKGPPLPPFDNSLTPEQLEQKEAAEQKKKEKRTWPGF